MVYRRSDIEKMVHLIELEYARLIQDHILLEALVRAGVKRLPIFKAANSIMRNECIEVKLKPIHSYRLKS